MLHLSSPEKQAVAKPDIYLKWEIALRKPEGRGDLWEQNNFVAIAWFFTFVLI
jgi:hypothetical protein